MTLMEHNQALKAIQIEVQYALSKRMNELGVSPDEVSAKSGVPKNVVKQMMRGTYDGQTGRLHRVFLAVGMVCKISLIPAPAHDPQ